MVATLPPEILQLSVSERIQLIEDIWDSIAATPEQLPLTQAQKDELDRRIEAYHQNPDVGFSWQEVQEKIRALHER